MSVSWEKHAAGSLAVNEIHDWGGHVHLQPQLSCPGSGKNVARPGLCVFGCITGQSEPEMSTSIPSPEQSEKVSNTKAAYGSVVSQLL